ncbi:MAG: DUF2341 domain-containing protein [Nitrososphaeria archaeon]
MRGTKNLLLLIWKILSSISYLLPHKFRKRLSSTQRLFLNVIIASIFLVFGVWIYTSFSQPEQSEAAWFNDQWLYRQKVDITNSSGSNLTDFQVAIVLNTAQLITDGKLQSDCDDIRFVDQKGNMLPHWRIPATLCNTSSTKYLVRTKSIPTNGNTIFVYYGNPTAQNIEDAGKVLDQGGIRGFFYAHSGSFPATSTDFDTFFTSNIIGFQGQQLYSQINCANNNCNPFDPDDNYYATYFEGVIYIPTTGNYNFATDSDDASDIYIDGDLTASSSAGTNVANWYGGHGFANNWSHNGSIVLTKGYHTFRYRMEEHGGGDGFRAAWQKPGDSSYSYITGEYFYSRKYASSEPTISFGAEEQSPGPVGYWSMDEGSGSIVHDKTARGNNGTINGATWKPKSECKVGSCLYFDGINDLVDFGNISNTATVAGNLTISFWLKPTNISKGRQNPLGKAYGGEFNFTLETNGSINAFHGSAGKNTSPYINITTATYLQNNQWTHVVYTRDVTTRTLKYYINGKLDKTQTYSSTYDPQPSNRSFKFGYEYAGYYQGYLDEVIIFPTVKSEEEVKALYAAGNAGTTAIKGASTSIGSYNKSSLNEGLVAYWKMDEASWNGDCSTTSVTDSSGNDNSGVACPNLSAANASSSGKFGGAGYFDGNNDYVNISGNSNLNNLTNFTVAFWASASASTQAYSMLVTKFTTDAQATFQIMRNGTNNRIEYRIGDGSSVYTQIGSINIFDDQWHYVVYSYDGKTVRAFVDGKKDVEQALSITPYTTTNPVTIGSRGGAGGYYLRGMMDEVRIYNRAISPAEAQELYNFAPGPVAYYDFEEGQGTTLNDKSGNNITATLGGDGLGTDIPSWTSGKFGKALLFDGSDDYVSISNPTIDDFDLGGMTVTAWIKTSSTSFAEIIDNKGGGSNNSGFNLQLEGGTGKPYFRIANGTTQNNTGAGPTNVADGKWHHIAGVLERGLTSDRMLLYVDGILVRSVNNSPEWNITSTQTLFIGAYGASPGDGNFSGIIDEVRIYNYARTQKQIIEDMNAGHPIGGSPVGSQVLYLKFDEGYGTTAYDSGPNRINGTITSCSWTIAGKFNKGINCNGGGYVTLGSNTAFDSSSFTYTFWIKTGVLGANQYSNIILGRENYTVSGFRAGLDNSGRVYFWTTQSGGTLSLISNRSVTGDWHHVAVTYDSTSSTGTIYIDGKKDVTATGTYIVPTGVSLVLNGGIGGTTRSNSLFDEFKFYSSALSSNEIQIDYNRNASFVMGATSTSDDGTTASSSASRAYCIPGDTSVCNPPVGEWKFEEGSGGTVNDTSGNGNTGTWNGTGTRWLPGKIGRSGNFNGTNSYVNIPSFSSINYTQSYTIEAWINPDQLGNANSNCGDKRAYIISTQADNTNFVEIAILNTGKLLYRQTGSPSNTSIISSSTLTTNRWYHVVAEYDSSINIIRLYIDGKLDGSTSTAGITLTNPSGQPLRFGWNSHNCTNSYFQGKIDHVQLYDYVRSPAQIAWDYNRGKPIAHWKFDECQGSKVNDSSGNGNLGTITIGATGSQTSVGTCSTSSTAWGNGAIGKFNHSLNFDGTDDYINFGDNSNFDFGTNDFSYCFWIKTIDTAGQVVGKGVWSYDAWGSYISSGKVRFEMKIENPPGNNYTTDSAVINDGNWHHVCGVYDRDTSLNAYTDGQLTSRNTSFSSAVNYDISNSSNFAIGNGSPGYLSGQLDEIQVFNYALTANQIKSLYNQGSAIRFAPATSTP